MGTEAGQAVEKESDLDPRVAFQIDCLRNAKYHEDRERFFAAIHKGVQFVVVLSGTAVFAWTRQAFFFAGVITVFSLIDLVFDVSGKARLHASLRRRIYDVLAQVENSKNTLEELREQAVRVYADEPPCYHAANMLAYNAALEAFDRPKKHLMVIAPWKRALRNWWPFTQEEFKTVQETAASANAQT